MRAARNVTIPPSAFWQVELARIEEHRIFDGLFHFSFINDNTIKWKHQ